ncbi:hypothetical protein [Micromonospora sp. KC721]|uniref:hypothetical protein n=1 Tax=Micromonospora sp. KC721 TaxID=2530380 RepID=UPI00104421D2|nr:hypothetical protein [Micromonospora sp. KC721]TDB72772.1 hypothetical protein E1182_22410 [Micromonospora sp. KC721]
MRSSPLAIVKIAVLAGLLTGCASAPTGTPSADATPEGTASSATGRADFRVVLTRTGGLAGRDDTVTVESDGQWTVTGRGGALRKGRLSSAGLDQLRALTENATSGDGGASTGGRCADTFRYRLTVPAGSVAWTDCPTGPQPPPAAATIAYLLFTATGIDGPVTGFTPAPRAAG